MNLLDEQYTRTPFYGVPKMTVWLHNQGYHVNHKRVERLMKLMCLQAIFPKQNISQKHPGHRIYPYLLRDVKILYPDHVWSTDITYIRLKGGFLYLVAVIDWFSRYVLSWRLSNTLDVYFCIEALEEALTYGTPKIFNTDQGSQFTSDKFTGILQKHQVEISMDGRGRALDNIFVERLWRTVKYENVYLYDYQTPLEAYRGLDQYFKFYNEERIHQSLDYLTPAKVYKMARNGFSKALENLSSDKYLLENLGAGICYLRPIHRPDEFSTVYPSTSCSPAEPVSVSTDS